MQESSEYFPRLLYRCRLDFLRSSAAKRAHLTLNYLMQLLKLCVFLYRPLVQ